VLFYKPCFILGPMVLSYKPWFYPRSLGVILGPMVLSLKVKEKTLFTKVRPYRPEDLRIFCPLMLIILSSFISRYSLQLSVSTNGLGVKLSLRIGYFARVWGRFNTQTVWWKHSPDLHCTFIVYWSFNWI